jgi:dTDP-4-dehydrorhamnose reductase
MAAIVEPVVPRAQRFLVFGKNGWVGGMLIELLKSGGKEFFLADSRCENRESVLAELKKYQPTHVLNAAGITGTPNVDWCETNQEQAPRATVLGSMTGSDLCQELGIHCTPFATGSPLEHDAVHPIGGKAFTEEDKPNFDGSFYSKTKGFLEQMLLSYKTTMVLRLRMPISDDLSPRSFVTKIVRYDKVVDVPNSMTVLSDMLPAALLMADAGLVGVYNFCNPGAISHNEVLALYKEIIDPGFTWTNFTVEEQNKILAAKRSNNELDATKLQAALTKLGGPVPEVHAAFRSCFERMKAKLVAVHGADYSAVLPKKLGLH